MQQCTNCQADLPANAQFCSHCGTSFEKSQTRSANLDETDTQAEELEVTSKQPAVTASAAPASAVPALPTLRTRRMHPKSSIEAFPQDPWVPQGSADAEESAAVTDTPPGEQDAFSPILQLPLTPIVETIDDEPQAQEAPDNLDVAAPILLDQTAIDELGALPPSPVTPDGEMQVPPGKLAAHASSTPLSTSDETSLFISDDQAPALSTPLAASDENTVYPIDDLTQVSSAPLPASDGLSMSPTDNLAAASSLAASTPGDVSTSPTGELLYTPTFSMSMPGEISTSPTNELEPIPSTPLPDEISTSPTNELEPVPSTPLPDEISTSPTGELALVPLTPTLDEISATPTDNLERAPLFPPPTPERRSTPRPVKMEAQPQLSLRSAGKGAGRVRPLIVALIIVLMVLAAGVGAFALGRQNAPTGTNTQCNAQSTNCANGSPVVVNGKPTHLTFVGAVAGAMTIVAKPSCQNATSGSLRTLTVNLSGTINDQLYNFGFAIEHYTGSGTYNSAADTTLLFDAPGESTTNGWGNNAPTDTGSITVDRGEQTGSISYTLSGVGSHANTQIQITGNWTCGK